MNHKDKWARISGRNCLEHANFISFNSLFATDTCLYCQQFQGKQTDFFDRMVRTNLNIFFENDHIDVDIVYRNAKCSRLVQTLKWTHVIYINERVASKGSMFVPVCHQMIPNVQNTEILNTSLPHRLVVTILMLQPVSMYMTYMPGCTGIDI